MANEERDISKGGCGLSDETLDGMVCKGTTFLANVLTNS